MIKPEGIIVRHGVVVAVSTRHSNKPGAGISVLSGQPYKAPGSILTLIFHTVSTLHVENMLLNHCSIST